MLLNLLQDDNDNDSSSHEVCEFIPDIPGSPPHKLPEGLEKIQGSHSNENVKQVTSKMSDMSMNC